MWTMGRRWALAALLMATAVACGGTRTDLRAVWKNPEAPPGRFERTIVAVQTSDASLRRAMEDAIVRQLPNATASYSVLNEEQIKDPAAAKARVTSAGFDGAVVARLVGVEQETSYMPGTTWWGPAPYGSMWGYWGYGWGAVYDPGYLVQENIVTLETNVYDVQNDRLVWASQSRTFTPASVDDLAESLVRATVSRMRREGAI